VETEDRLSENSIAAAIAELRDRFPRTQDLYREVCILLFFRHGITPTANKLYQLVRKGSMSAPTEALSDFWDTLRERARVRIEHADLPDELQQAAGEMVAALWKSAQTMARESLVQLRQEAASVAESARNAEAEAKAAEAAALGELDRTRERLRDAEGQIGQLRQELAAAAATNVGTVTRLEDARQLLAQNQEMLARARDEHAAEREKLAERTRLAEQRFADMERRALLDIDRERTASVKLQKTLESERAEHVKSIDRLRAECNTVQVEVGGLREQVGALQNATVALKDERDRAFNQLRETRTQLEATIRLAASDATRADHLGEELKRLRNTAAQQRAAPAASLPKATTARRRSRKATSEDS
jgi:chromosome segregation ATPase